MLKITINHSHILGDYLNFLKMAPNVYNCVNLYPLCRSLHQNRPGRCFLKNEGIMPACEEILNSPFFITLSLTHLHCYLLHVRTGSFTSFIFKHVSRYDEMPGGRDSGCEMNEWEREGVPVIDMGSAGSGTRNEALKMERKDE